MPATEFVWRVCLFFTMCFRWIGKQKKRNREQGKPYTKPYTKEFLDNDIDNWKKEVVTGKPVNETSEEEKNKQYAMFPVNVNSTSTMQELIDKGYTTDGKIDETSWGPMVWYIKNVTAVPLCPEDDKKGEYKWLCIPYDDLLEYQGRGWMARANKKNHLSFIWVCCVRK